MPSHRRSSTSTDARFRPPATDLPSPTPESDGPDATGSGRARWVVLGAVVLILVAGGGWLLLGRSGGDDATGDGVSTAPPVDLASALSVEDFGAVGDGRTDDTESVQAALDAAEVGQGVLFAAGRTYAVSDVVTVATEGVVLTGGGTILATDEERSSLTIAADRVVVQDLTLDIVDTTRRWDAYEQQRLRLDGHSGIVVRDVLVDGSAAAGVYVGGTGDFLLDGVEVTGTRADGIHMTQGAHDGRVVSPLVRDVGDDGVAVVSYAPDGEPCARIEIDSPVVAGTDARGVSVVGGTDVTFSDIEVSDTAAAGVYIAAEGSYDTAGVDGVRVDGGTVTGANTDAATDHGAVLVYNGTADRPVQDVVVSGLTLVDTRPEASRWVGVVVDQGGPVSGVLLEGLALDGDGPETEFATNAPDAGYENRDWTRDGDALEDRDGGS